ncbi:MAG TPA: GYD domain-containing protein, partial [Solirubrobacteraceae bacterium]|nr:GYD domain-containing protein [Solirubrobacteraceae bacterium]
MPRYVTLLNWTDQGVKGFKDSISRFEAVQQAGGASGVRFTDIYWTIGPYDLVGVVEAPDDETLTAALLA